MRLTDIYQTLEDRHNEEYVVSHGPFLCKERTKDGKRKGGIKEPWLGEGYYFWDTRIEDAQWWGDTVYKKKGYFICHTQYDQRSELLFDIVGDISQFDEFINCAKLIMEMNKIDHVSFPTVLHYLKNTSDFKYKAIRVWPFPPKIEKTNINFPDDKMGLAKLSKIQICFFDKTLLTYPYELISDSDMVDQTI
jgi:hypothetical protein